MMRLPLPLLALTLACATSAPPSTPAAPTAAPASATAPAGPPLAKREPHVRELHGERFVDDWFWLRNKGTPEVETYLHAEAAYAERELAPLAPLREQLFTEIVSHIAEDDDSAPYKDGAYRYWRRERKGKSYPTFLRKGLAKDAPEEVILDQNALAEGKEFLGLGTRKVSDDGRWLLYSTDDTGFRQYTLQFKELATGTLAPERIEKVVSASWAADNRTVLYVVEDAAKRPYRLYLHTVGTAPATDVLIYEEKDERFDLSVWRTTSLAYFVVHSESQLAAEVRLIDATKPASPPVLVEPRSGEIKYSVAHRGKELWILVNDTGRNFRLVRAPLSSPGKKSWQEVRAHDERVMLESLQVFSSFYVLATREGGLPRLVVHDFGTKKTVPIAMPEADCGVWGGPNAEFNASEFRYRYTSLATPMSDFSYDVKKQTSTLLKEAPVPGGFDRTRYRTEYLQAKAKDGTSIPISLVSRTDVPRDGSAPLHLYAYGSYGMSMPAYFEPELLTLLDRGVVFAIAHIRGGGELGKAWHEQGRLAHKMNTFTDFIACAEHLIANNYTSPKRLTIQGGSAGGLLMGAVANLRPDLWKAVLNQVPFVDVINTMNDASLPLTVTEYEEWGNPTIKEQYDWMRPYSPYDNLEKKDYPAMLVESSYNDSQVMYWEPAKYVARLRTLKTDTNPLLFKIRMEPAGHGGKSGRYDRFRDLAYDQAFLLWQLGVVEKPGG